MSQNGSVIITINRAAIVQASDQNSPSHHEPPWRRSSVRWRKEPLLPSP